MPSSNQKVLWIALAVVLLAAILFIVFRSSASAKVGLTVTPDKPSYKAGDAISLTVRLHNAGTSETCVSDMSAGSVRFLSLMRDGQAVATRSAPAYFLAAFPDMMAASLLPLKPGEDLDLTLTSAKDEGLGKQALRTTAPDDSRGKATFYDVETPGTYELKVAYDYPGRASATCSNVFKGATDTVTLSFTVTP